MSGMARHVNAPLDEEPTESRTSAVPAVDRVNIVAQQLATSLRVPLGRPVLVGGMTFPGPQTDEPAGQQLYLVIEVTVQEEADSASPAGIQSPRRQRR
jgi:hypothetical protein